jgi:uncharacterized protein (TIGR04222 family)
MDRMQAELWQRIDEFSIDEEGASFQFTDRLARENGWSRSFAQRVVGEYKRFVFLAIAAGHAVTPSDEVDEAWHLHLTYTRSYWNSLCRDVLGKPLHHVPTRGGPAERERHVAQYNQTLVTYEQIFGHAPPSDIWPPAEVRFDKNARYERVNRADAWIVRKPRFPRFMRKSSLVAGAVVAPLLVGVVNPLNIEGPQFLVFYAILCSIAVVIAFALRQFLRRDEPADDTQPLTPYEVACLANGPPGVLRACLASLLVNERIDPVDDGKTKKFKSVASLDMGGHDVERAMLTVAANVGATTGELLEAGRPGAESIEKSLQDRKLMESRESFAATRWAPVAVLGAVFLLGLAKLVVGISRDKPVLFLAGILIVLFLAAVIGFLRVPLRTRRGDELLQQLKSQNDRLKSLDLYPQGAMTGATLASNDLLLAAGLFGLAALHHPDVDALSKTLKPISDQSSSGCGASSGCGGGGDGGGCGGGCGGCGGD